MCSYYYIEGFGTWPSRKTKGKTMKEKNLKTQYEVKKQRDKTVRRTKAWIEKVMGTKCIIRFLFNEQKKR